jgi:hypothetical protein
MEGVGMPNYRKGSRGIKPLVLRIDHELVKLVEKVSEIVSRESGGEVTKSEILKTFLELSTLEFLSMDSCLGDELRLAFLTRLLRHYSRAETDCYLTYKSYLRSNEYVVQDHENELDDGSRVRKDRYTRLGEIMSQPDEEKREALLAILNLRYHYAKRIEETALEIKEILKRRGEFLSLEELKKKDRIRRPLTSDVYF